MPRPCRRFRILSLCRPMDPDGYYQNFTVTIPSYLAKGPAIFTLTHFCLIGADWYPFLEFRNATVNIV
ncbi:uncharacterized protein F5891DRAFT_592129 [Suillus fuscotomentosus]|uniref:Uncharacterized protein n=1 Tax=Suillus fuscotomentosus TaxID=1912939 RepID=A0AAD4DYE8_9AGAM|nr:uncharacterized protein F5891DRAFT_592129 [Suillus fuscotomentosus]KAG1896406.1 hypothetical protein F5891DRAFT_592129 [Suillus fuscotomentosus]